MNFFKSGIKTGLALLMAGGLVSAARGGDSVAGIPRRLTLDDCVRLVLKQNPQILAAEHQIEASQGQVIIARAQALPQITQTGDYYKSASALVDTGLPFQEKSWNVTLQATQLLYSGGQVQAAIKSAKLAADSSYYALRDTIDTTISTVKQQFYTVLLDRALIDVQEEAVELLQGQLSDQTKKFKAGAVAHFNVLQAEVALSNEQPLLINAKNQYLISQMALAQTLGIHYEIWHPGASSKIEVTGSLDTHYQPVDQDAAVRLAKERRPFLKMRRQSILIELQQIKIALAGYQPTVSANGGWQIQNSLLTQKLGDQVNGWFFGATANWAVFDGLATYGKVKTARSQLESAKTDYDSAVLQVVLQVQQAVANLREAHETLLSQVKGVDEAREALRLSQVRFNAGSGVQLDVLNAQVALAQARTSELQAMHDYDVARAQFEYATGLETQYTELFDDPLLHKKAAPRQVRASN